MSGLIGTTSPDPYAGLGIFRPQSSEQAAATQHAHDAKQAGDAIALCVTVKMFAAGRLSALGAVTQWLQVQQLPIDTNKMNDLETARESEKAASASAAQYQGAVEGWLGGIQSIRSIASRSNPVGDDLKARLVFPVMPQSLSDYIAENNLG